MRSPIGFLRSLTLPYGATTGARIFLDGLSATINMYNAAGFFFATLTSIGGLPGIYVFGTDGSQVSLALLNATGATRIENLTLANVFRIANARIETDTVAAAGGPVGAVVGRLEVFDQAGNSLGFLPVYDAIP